MRKSIAMALCVAALSLAGPMKAFAADPCSGTIGGMTIPVAGGNLPTLGSTPGPVGIPSDTTGPLYLDVRSLGDDTTYSIWLYEESNGKNRLQRGGHSIFPDTPATSGAEPCQEAKLQRVAPDQDIF